MEVSKISRVQKIRSARIYENNTPEFEEAMQILDKCSNIETNSKDKRRNTKCKTTQLNTEEEKKIKCLKVFTKVGTLKNQN